MNIIRYASTKKLGILVFFMCALAQQAYATTYKSQFREFATNHATYSNFVSAGSHKFIVDGVLQHTWADLYVNGTHIPPSQESTFPFYVDPTFNRSIQPSDIVEVIVYDADDLSIWERHRWTVDTTPPTAPGTPDLSSSDDTGQSSSDDITKYSSGLTFSWSSSRDGGTGLAGYEWRLDSGSWNWIGNSTSVNISASHGSHTFYVRAKDGADNPSSSRSNSFVVDTVDPNVPLISYPSVGQHITDTTPRFDWSGSDNSGGSGIWQYEILVEYDTMGENLIHEYPTSSYYQTPSSQELDAGEGYDWELWAYDVAGNSSSGTGEKRFYIDELPKDGEILSADPDTFTGSPREVTVTVRNLGRDDHNLIVLWDSKPPDWSISPGWPNYQQMIVPYNTTADFTFTVTPPSSSSSSGTIVWVLEYDDPWTPNNTRLDTYSQDVTSTVPEIMSAYWLGDLDVPDGTEVTMRAEVRNFSVGDEFTFAIWENDLPDSDNPANGNPAPQGTYSGGDFVDATWTAKWEEDGVLGVAGDPEFYFIVSHGSISEKSNNELKVRKAPPKIKEHPQSQNPYPGYPASFSVVATGTPTLEYQWQKKDGGTFSNISGATSSSYHISAAQESDEGVYRCVVSNKAGSATSNSATLTLSPPAKPTLVSPPNNEEPLSTRETQQLQWSSAAGTERYRVYVNGSHNQTVLPPNTSCTLINLVPDRTYSWYVVAVNDADPEGTTSDIWSFTIEGVPVFDRFKFDTIHDTEKNTPFTITVRAIMSDGSLATDFTGSVDLESNPVRCVNPTSIYLNDGVGQVQISMAREYPSSIIKASFWDPSVGEVHGQSNEFAVGSGTGDLTGAVREVILDNSCSPPRVTEGYVTGATVTLLSQEGQQVDTDTSDLLGRFSFTDEPPGSYRISTEVGDLKSEEVQVKIVADQPVHLDLYLRSQKPPVILVPGVMGSTVGIKIGWPELGAEYPATQSTLSIADGVYPLWDLGWSVLQLELEANGYEVFLAPYDWRVPLFAPASTTENAQPAWQRYLKPVIDEAKRVTHHDKVYIVAHSMGGLVARTYIQSPQYDFDVDKFVMLGTPNEGSPVLYPLWAGGDLLAVEDLTDAYLRMVVLKFTYENMMDVNSNLQGSHSCSEHVSTIFRQLAIPDNDSPWLSPTDVQAIKQRIEAYLKVGSAKVLKDFCRQYVPTLRELLPTYDYLEYTSGTGETSPPGDPKTRPLYKLNHGEPGLFSNPESRYTSESGDTEKVLTRVLLSKGFDTIDTISVETTDASLYAPYGRPTGVLHTSGGDGTVTAASALGKAELGGNGLTDFMSVIDTEKTSHGKLVKRYLSKIVSFLNGRAKRNVELSAEQVQELESPVLEISFIGSVKPLITDPNGHQLGVDPVTGDSITDIPSCRLAVNDVSSNLRIRNPAEGSYSVTFSGLPRSEAKVVVGYTSSVEGHVEYRFRFVCSEEPESFGFVLDSLTPDILKITAPVNPPVDIVARRIDGDLTQLEWSPPAEAMPVQYRIYNRRQDEVLYTLLDSTTETSFDTGHVWNGDGTGETWYYVILGVTEDGTESYFTYTAENGQPLVASFSSDVRSGPPHLDVTFMSDESSGEINVWEWDFDGDGVIDSTDQDPTWTYTETGDYTVTLTVSGPRGSDMRVAEKYISVEAPDTDGDGIPDDFETNTGVFVSETDTGTDPLNPDTDGDGLQDGVETNTETFVDETDTGTDPLDPDTDGDGLQDSVETNTGTFVDQTDTGTDPLDPDTDDDSMPDGWEADHALDPCDNTGDNGADGDPDDDNYTNLQEYQGGSHPQDENSVPTVEATLSFREGWNLIALAVEATATYTAESFGQGIYAQGGACDRICRWDGSRWQTHLIGMPFGDIDMVVGEGYFALCTAASELQIEGTPLEGQECELREGWNLISVTADGPYTAESLGQEINVQGGACDRICRWDGSRWQTHLIGMPFGDFDIMQEEGYFVLCTVASTWRPGE